jgi:hypothetical protein
MITTETLPATRWREPAELTATVGVPRSGVLIGVDRMLNPVVLPALGPRPVRLGVLGDQRIAALLAYRLLGVGCVLTVVTAAPARWRGLLRAAGSRAVVGSRTTGWSRRTEEPQLLVSDLPTVPDVGDRPFSTTVHVAATVPTGSPYWSGVDGVVAAGTGHGGPLAVALDRADARELDAIGPGQLGVLTADAVAAVTPVLADPERALLLGR